MLRVVPNKGILFMCNDYYVSWLRSSSFRAVLKATWTQKSCILPKTVESSLQALRSEVSLTGESLLGRFASGSLAGLTSAGLTYPLEVLQSRMGSGRYRSLRHCVQRTWSQGFKDRESRQEANRWPIETRLLHLIGDDMK